MKKLFLGGLLGLFCLALVGCEPASTPPKVNADNTGRNVRDRDASEATAGDQSESAADRTITQAIRRLLMEDSNLSMKAKNIKIITSDGVVILKGPVDSEREKLVIVGKAKQTNGVKNVEDRLEVVSK